MRKPQDITIDRALLINLLQLAEPYGFMSDVKFQQLIFLSELQQINEQFALSGEFEVVFTKMLF